MIVRLFFRYYQVRSFSSISRSPFHRRVSSRTKTTGQLLKLAGRFQPDTSGQAGRHADTLTFLSPFLPPSPIAAIDYVTPTFSHNMAGIASKGCRRPG